jgi:ABC-type amino acid transport substrate-binding protein/signal transduction histidine kinase/ActR/RegA family two-component response regulator
MNPISSLRKSVGTYRAFARFSLLGSRLIGGWIIWLERLLGDRGRPHLLPASITAKKLIFRSIRLAGLILIWGGLSIVQGWCDDPLTVRVGAYENRPKIYTNSQGGVVGIFPDILDTIAYEEGWRLEYVPGTWSQCLERLEKNEIDFMVDVAYSDERERRYDFSDESVFINWATVYTKSGFAIQSLLDLRGKTVAVMRKSIHTEGSGGIKQLASRFDLDLTYIEVDSYDEVFALLDSAAADAGVVNRLYGALNEKSHDILKTVLLFNPVQLKFATAKGNSHGLSLLERVDLQLKRLKNDPDSVYHEIISAYLNGTEFLRRFKNGVRQVPLTFEERAWLDAHPVIRIGVDPAYAPYSFRDEEGSYLGLAMDYVILMGRHLGLRMKVVPGLTWPQILEGARSGSLDVVVTAVKTREREEYLRFSKIYIPTPLVIMARDEDQTIDGPEDMAGHTVALVKGYSSAERTLAEHPAIKPYLVGTPLEGLTALSAGEADLYVGVLGINDYLSKKHGLTNLKVASRYDMCYVGQRFGVRKEWPQLVSILDKTLDAIPEKKKISLRNAWISTDTALRGAAALQQRHCLTEQETDWIRNHPTIRLGVDPEFAPFEFFSKEGAYRGIASDYVKILNCRLGLNMEVVPDLTWKETMAAAGRKELDVLPCVAVTEDRRPDLNFSEPYLNFHRIIINRTDAPFFSDLNDIAGLKVAAQAETSHSGYLKDHTTIEPTLYPTLQEALRAVSDGQADVFVGNIASATYWIRNLQLTNLKVAAPASHELQKLHFAVRKDWPELVAIINKGLASISLYKEDKIRKHWIDVEYDPGIDPARFWKRIMQVAGGALFVLCAVAGWNFMLNKEIRKRRVIEKNLTYRLDFETLLLEMSSLFINLKTRQINEQISQALNRIAAFVEAQSGFLFAISDHGKRFFSSHGWFSDQLKEKMDNFRQLDAAALPWWVEHLNRNEVIAVSSVEQLPDQAAAEKELLLSAGINAIVSIPMSMGGEITGFLGVACTQNHRHWSDDEITLLQAMGQIFTNALQRKQAEEAQQRSHDELELRIAERTADLEKANVNLQQEITERQRMEVEKEQLAGQLVYAQKMEAIGTMAGGIAHDFNNILMPIIGYAEMTKLALAAESEEWKNQDHIISAGNRAKELIRQILTFSRQTVHGSEPVDLKSLVRETLKLMRSSLPLAVEIRESIDPQAGDIIGNPTQIHQLLMNLCTNARHAMHERGGILTVSVDEVRYPDGIVLEGHPLEAGSYIRLRISDTGKGIEKSIECRILEPYFTTKAPDEGTGLGLSVVHGIVKKHGGHLTFSSEVNQGTTFQILFPKQSTNSVEKIAEPEPTALGGAEKIWVLDDEKIIVQMIQKMLQGLGYGVKAFTRGDQLIGEFKSRGDLVDLVVTDMTMPNLTGVELARQLIDLRDDIPIILCSGFNETIDAAAAKKIGIREYLMKPVDMKELANTVRKVLDDNISESH